MLSQHNQEDDVEFCKQLGIAVSADDNTGSQSQFDEFAEFRYLGGSLFLLH